MSGKKFGKDKRKRELMKINNPRKNKRGGKRKVLYVCVFP